MLLSLHTHINLHIFACVWVLWSRSLSLLFLFSFLDLAALTALANNLNSPTQSIDVFVLHVCYFFLFSFYYSFNEPCKLPLLYWNLGPSIFLILSRSQPAAGSFKIIQQKNEKTNTTENYFYFGLWHSHTMILCYPICGREMQDDEQGEEGGVLILLLSCMHVLALAIARSQHSIARDKCFVSGQIKIEASGGTYYLIAHVPCTFVPNLTPMHEYACIRVFVVLWIWKSIDRWTCAIANVKVTLYGWLANRHMWAFFYFWVPWLFIFFA